jgi:heme exporter protein D
MWVELLRLVLWLAVVITVVSLIGLLLTQAKL